MVCFRLALVSLSLYALGASPMAAVAQPGPDWSAFLTRSEIGADRWNKAHPSWDGRGVTIAVLDTGVDPSLPGLDRLPDGGVKVIEARDFTGQGAVALRRARLEGGILYADGFEVRSVETLSDKPIGQTGYWVGVFDEKALRRGSVEDIDGDGRNDTRFAIVAFLREGGDEVVVIDTDGDFDLRGESVRRSYREDPRHFFFGRAPKRRIAVTPHVDLMDRRVELHFDDGAHGTHCAGIAAGHRIEGRDGFDGIAPGATVMSLKIGHGGLAGGATVKGSMLNAIRYASAWAREHRRWVVISLSYGIGSETEGDSEIDRALDAELLANPFLLAAVSASNEGPGLSSVGTPAAATLAFATAAMVTPRLADTLLGAGSLKTNRIFPFSSRGGELDKPDGLAPGIAWSTVPAFNEKAVMNGTSMAAPQVAGAMALLLSAALAERMPVSSGLVRRALRHGARPLPGYSRLDQGAGLVDVSASWAAMRALKAGAVPLEAAGFEVRTPLPGAPGRTGSASYWRVGAGLLGLGAGIGGEGNARETVTFTIKPLIHGTVADEHIPRVMQVVALESDVAWLFLQRRELAFKGDAALEVPVAVELSKLRGPGVHVGRVRARQGGLWAFDLPVVVVIPQSFRDTWTTTFEGALGPGEVARVFVEVPAGASGMVADLAAGQGRGRGGRSEGSLWLIPFDQAGRHVEAYRHRASPGESLAGRFAQGGAALGRGIWELTVVAPLRNPGPLDFALNVVFSAIDGPEVLRVTTDAGGTSSAELLLVNRMDQPFAGRLDASVIGASRVSGHVMREARYGFKVAVGPQTEAVELALEVDEATWARLTDFAFDVVDGAGVAVAQEAFSQRTARVRIDVPRLAEPSAYEVELAAGLTDPGDDRALEVKVTELHRLRAPVVWTVTPPRGMGQPTLFPGVPTRLSLSATGVSPVGDGFAAVTELALIARDGSLWQRWQLPHARP